jgi:hypothetical protein
MNLYRLFAGIMPALSTANRMKAGKAMGAESKILEVAVYTTAFLAASFE